MATRNRTHEFLQIRNSCRRMKHTTAEREGLLTHTGDDVEMTPQHGSSATVDIKPEWAVAMDGVRAKEAEIREKMSQLSKLHTSHIRVDFGSTRDEGREEHEIQLLTGEISKIFKAIETALTALEKRYTQERRCTQSELSILHNVKLTLVNEVNTLSKQFREGQRKYLQQLKKQKESSEKRRRVLTGNEQVHDRMEREAQIDDYLQKGMTQDQIEMIMLNRESIDRRDKELQDIYQSIADLHEMFSDMNQLVIEQGSMLDRIDYNMELTHKSVVKGNIELQKAVKHQKAGRFKLCVLFLIIMIMGFACALLFKIAA